MSKRKEFSSPPPEYYEKMREAFVAGDERRRAEEEAKKRRAFPGDEQWWRAVRPASGGSDILDVVVSELETLFEVNADENVPMMAEYEERDASSKQTKIVHSGWLTGKGGGK